MVSVKHLFEDNGAYHRISHKFEGIQVDIYLLSFDPKVRANQLWSEIEMLAKELNFVIGSIVSLEKDKPID